MAIHTGYTATLPPQLGPQPSAWLWLKDGELYTMVIIKRTDHSDKCNVIWWEEDGTQHVEIDARHISKVQAGTPCYVGTDGMSGYAPTT